MRIVIFVLLVFLLVSMTNVAAEVRTLDSFYSHVGQAASVLKAKADLEAQSSDLLAKEAQKGFELFGSISAGYQKTHLLENHLVVFLIQLRVLVYVILCWVARKSNSVQLVMRLRK